MRACVLILAALLGACLVIDYALAFEPCYESNCIKPGRCHAPIKSSRPCLSSGEVCCSEIKEEDKYKCEHFQGACMDSCNSPTLLRKADNCKRGTTCCVLV